MSIIATNHAKATNYAKYYKKEVITACAFGVSLVLAVVFAAIAIDNHIKTISSSLSFPLHKIWKNLAWSYFAASMASTAITLGLIGALFYFDGKRAGCKGQLANVDHESSASNHKKFRNRTALAACVLSISFIVAVVFGAIAIDKHIKVIASNQSLPEYAIFARQGWGYLSGSMIGMAASLGALSTLFYCNSKRAEYKGQAVKNLSAQIF